MHSKAVVGVSIIENRRTTRAKRRSTEQDVCFRPATRQRPAGERRARVYRLSLASGVSGDVWGTGSSIAKEHGKISSTHRVGILVSFSFFRTEQTWVVSGIHAYCTVCQRVHNDGSSFHGSGEACPACATCVNSPADRIFLCRVCVLMA